MEIGIESGIVNAVVFIVVDIGALWAIHRGLVALQGYFIYRISSWNKQVLLRRSRIPIVSGELLSSGKYYPSILILFNAVAIVFAFVAALGINGETKDELMAIQRQFVSTVEVTRNTPSSNLFNKCRENNRTQIIYWPFAFNKTGDKIKPDTVECLKDIPGFSPMMTITNCEPSSLGCSIARDNGPVNRVKFLWDFPSYETKYFNGAPPPESAGRQWRYYYRSFRRIALSLQVADVTSDGNEKPFLRPGDTILAFQMPFTYPLHMFYYWVHVRRDAGNQSASVFLGSISSAQVQHRLMNSLDGQLSANGSKFTILRDLDFPLKLIGATARIHGDIVGRSDFFMLESMMDLPGCGEWRGSRRCLPSIDTYVDNLMHNGLHAKEINRSIFIKSRGPKKAITVVDVRAIVLLSILIVSAIFLVGTKELLLWRIGANSPSIRRALLANDYDMLSQVLRAEFEKRHDSELSGMPADMSTHFVVKT